VTFSILVRNVEDTQIISFWSLIIKVIISEHFSVIFTLKNYYYLLILLCIATKTWCVSRKNTAKTQ